MLRDPDEGRLPGVAAHADCRIHAHRRGFLRLLRDGASCFRTRRGASISSLALLIRVSPILLLFIRCPRDGKSCGHAVVAFNRRHRPRLLFRLAATRPDEAVRDSVVQCGRGAIPVRSTLKSIGARPRSVAEVYFYPRFHHAGEFLDVPIGKPDASV